MTTFLSYEPASFPPESPRGDAPQALPAVRVADGAGERVRGICGRRAGKPEQPLHHFLHLFLFGVAVADHRLLDLERRVLGDRQTRVHRGADRRAARLPQGERRCRVDVDEDLLHRDLLRLMRFDHLAQTVKDILEALRQFSSAALDAAAGYIGEPRAVFFDDPEPGDAQTRVDAKYPERGTGHCRNIIVDPLAARRRYWSITAVV